MNKLVYLYELDPTRNTEVEIRRAHQCIYAEIIENGNQIVLTCDQITDSDSFLMLLSNEESYNLLVQFINKGYIKFFQHQIPDGIKEPVFPCAQEHLKKENLSLPSFYITLDVESELKKDFTATFHSENFNLLDEKVASLTPKYELLQKYKKMFELLKLEGVALSAAQTLSQTEVPPLALWDVFLNVDRFFRKSTEMTLTASGEKLLLSNGQYMRSPSSEKKHPKEKSTLYILQSGLEEELIQLLPISFALLHDWGERIHDKNSRSEWKIFLQSREVKTEIEALQSDGQLTSSLEKVLALIECLIDLFYNYSVEYNIMDVCPHYSWDTCNEAIQYSLISDFCFRLLGYWNDFCLGHHLCFQKNPDDKSDNWGSYINDLLVQWSAAIKLLPKAPSSCGGEPYAENKADLEKQKKSWKRVLKENLFHKSWIDILNCSYYMFIDVFMHLLKSFFYDNYPFQLNLEIFSFFQFMYKKNLEFFLFSEPPPLMMFTYLCLLNASIKKFFNIPNIIDLLQGIIDRDRCLHKILQTKHSHYQITLEENKQKEKACLE